MQPADVFALTVEVFDGVAVGQASERSQRDRLGHGVHRGTRVECPLGHQRMPVRRIGHRCEIEGVRVGQRVVAGRMQLDERGVAGVNADEEGRTVDKLADVRSVSVGVINDRVASIEFMERGNGNRVICVIDGGVRVKLGLKWWIGNQCR